MSHFSRWVWQCLLCATVYWKYAAFYFIRAQGYIPVSLRRDFGLSDIAKTIKDYGD